MADNVDPGHIAPVGTGSVCLSESVFFDPPVQIFGMVNMMLKMPPLTH